METGRGLMIQSKLTIDVRNRNGTFDRITLGS